MERPTLTSLAWSDTGELSHEARATQETIERLRQFDGEVILTREEITRVYQFKADEIRQYQEWLQSPCLLYTSPSPRDRSLSRMPSSA